ncbi:MAG: hypothetical protein OEU92_12725 [Alphaproteobacteria bacterium]|nr:hypothetical protein [Alphaproteobacteria bacterium]
MHKSRRTVHIPIVQPGASEAGVKRQEDRLIEIYTQHQGLSPLSAPEAAKAAAIDSKARDKDWDQVAAPLRKVGLYQAGCAAASAVRKLGIEPPFGALYQQVARLAWIEAQRLQSASPSGPSEGRSAELGLALALLMGASGSPDRQVIATGALGGQPSGHNADDVEILPVGSLPGKLDLVLTLASHDNLPRFNRERELLFFTPLTFEDDGEQRDVSSLPVVEQLLKFGVHVVPVGRLGEAATILKARRARHLAADRFLQAGVAALALVVAAGAAWHLWPSPKITMTFLPAGGMALAAEPYQACFTPDGGYYPVPLDRDGIVRTMPAGSTLGWNITIDDPGTGEHLLGRWVQPDQYHVAQIMLASSSPAKVVTPSLPDGRPIELPPGGAWEWGWKLTDKPENNMLVLLAQPEKPFDAAEIRRSLVEQFPANGADGGLDLTAAANFLSTLAPGSVRFSVRTVEEEERCDP